MNEPALVSEPTSTTALTDVYTGVRNYTEKLCKPLNKEDYIPQPVTFASPPKWHLAHTTWFFEEMVLKKYVKGYQEYDPEFSYLFNSYYQHAGKRVDRSERGAITRPGVEEVYRYRTHVDRHMFKLMETVEPGSDLHALIILGLNHEQQHQELLITDLKYVFGLNPLFPVYSEDMDLTSGQNKTNEWLSLPEGVYEIGYTGNGFCYDNELAPHEVYLQPFEISSALVTNGEYLEFMSDGGYADFRHWLDEGWSWVQENHVEAPLHWHQQDGEWFQYTLAGLKPIDTRSILAHISFYEAYAFASWLGMRLPTEFEWEAASDKFEWGKRWEWTYSAYLPYPGFRIAEGAVGEYNGKFMVNQMVLRGASRATSPGHSRKTYRNFFHPHYRWQYTGIRLAK